MLQDLHYLKNNLTNNLEFNESNEQEEMPVPYRWSHGATDTHLGDGLIIYSLIQYMRAKVCVCCAKTLTDEFSMLTTMGKTCAKHMKVEYIKNISEVERFRDDYMKRVEEIGEMETWIPLSQVKVLSDKLEVILKMVR